VDVSNTNSPRRSIFGDSRPNHWKPLSSNAIFVTNDNVGKRRDYEDFMLKVFYIKNATTVQELQELSQQFDR